jgi:glycosyltransferase involved in cell wall biosynthesis
MSPRRIVEFVTGFQIGGTERQSALLAAWLDPARYDVRFGCLRREGEFLASIEGRGLPIETYPVRNLWGKDAWRHRLRLARDLRRERVELVHAHGFYANVFAVPAARIAGVPAVLASIRDLNDLLWTPMQRRVQRATCLFADRVVVNAGAIRERLLGQGYSERKIAVVHNGIDPGRFAGPRTGGLAQELGLAPDAPLVAFVGRLVRACGIEIKGVGFFLEAAARLAPGHPRARFLVIGDGPCRPELERRAGELGLAGRVIFTGVRQDVNELLREIDVNVLPSLTEGLSNSLLEAMAAGLPVVATRVGGNPELVVDGEHGLLVPPEDAGALAAAIGRLLDDEALRARLGREARRRVESEFSVERMTATVSGLYDECLAGVVPDPSWTRSGVLRGSAGPGGPR